jgi:hypothetical protein
MMRIIGGGVVRKVGVVLVVALLGYLAFFFITNRLNKHHWDGVCMEVLMNLHQSWTADGRPAKYDVVRYYQSPSTIVRFYTDTNRYMVDGRTVDALFAAEYVWDKRPVVFLVTTDGELFERRGERLLRR